MLPSLRKKLDDAFTKYGGREPPARFLNCYTCSIATLRENFLAAFKEANWRVDMSESKREGLNYELNFLIRSPFGRTARVIAIGSDDLSGMVVFDCPL